MSILQWRQVTVDIYLYLEYGVGVQGSGDMKQWKSAVSDMAEVELSAVNIHVASIVQKNTKPDLKDLFDEDFLNDWYAAGNEDNYVSVLFKR